MADRKYRQQGYRGPESPRASAARPAARRRAAAAGCSAQRTVSRCGACGDLLPIATASLEQCPSCRAAIHACRSARTSTRASASSARRPIPQRIEDKAARNDCASFTLRVSVEKNASPDGKSAADIRRAFDNLFKK